jgi:proteic killer suppression protein
MAIVGFRHRGVKELFENGKSRRIGKRYAQKILELLDLLDAVIKLDELHGVSDFHPLRGDRAGDYSLHVNGNWCLVFKFVDGDAYDVTFEDYH